MAMQEAPALANERVMDLPIPFEAPQMKTFLPAIPFRLFDKVTQRIKEAFLLSVRGV